MLENSQGPRFKPPPENISGKHATQVKQFQDYTLYTTPNRSQTGWSLLPYPSEDHEQTVNTMV